MLLVFLLVMSTYILDAADPYFKDAATQQLYEAAVMIVPDKQIHIKCHAIDKALSAGADVKEVQERFNPAHDLLMAAVVESQKKKLLERFIKCDANIKVNWHGKPILALARKYAMVKLLLKSGAHTDLDEQQQYNVLSRIMDNHYDFELINLYTKHGFDATSRDDLLGWTLLMELALFPGSHMIPKATLLFKGLDPKQIRDLIEVKNNKLLSVFDIIKNKKIVCRSTMNDKSYAANFIYLEAYRTFLEEQVAECSICYDDFMNEKSVRTSCCKQLLHEGCLSQWVYSDEKPKVCPLCRDPKPFSKRKWSVIRRLLNRRTTRNYVIA